MDRARSRFAAPGPEEAMLPKRTGGTIKLLEELMMSDQAGVIYLTSTFGFRVLPAQGQNRGSAGLVRAPSAWPDARISRRALVRACRLFSGSGNCRKRTSSARGRAGRTRSAHSVFVRSAIVRQIVLFSAAVGYAVAQSPGTYTPAGVMTATRSQHAATLLLDGRVLLTGGYGTSGAGMASA